MTSARRVRVGCTGWGYDDWRGGFYPQGAQAGEYLERYARAFDLAEVDSIHYALPRREQVANWVRVTPPGFTFAPKAPGSVTHEARLRGAEEVFTRYLDLLEPLRKAGKLGPVMLGLPPSFSYEKDAEALDAFLGKVPSDVHVAVELRNRSWWRPEAFRMLESRGATLVWSENQYATTPPVLTSDRVYLRLIGDRELTRFDRIQRDYRASMEAWRTRLEDEGRSARETLVLVNNHFMGFAPATAAMMSEVLGLPAPDLRAAARDGGQRGLLDFG